VARCGGRNVRSVVATVAAVAFVAALSLWVEAATGSSGAVEALWVLVFVALLVLLGVARLLTHVFKTVGLIGDDVPPGPLATDPAPAAPPGPSVRESAVRQTKHGCLIAVTMAGWLFAGLIVSNVVFGVVEVLAGAVGLGTAGEAIGWLVLPLAFLVGFAVAAVGMIVTLRRLRARYRA
jgi:hypothetical protein